MKSVILIVVASLCMAIVASDRVLPEQETNLSLINFMARSNSLLQRNPTRSLDCFNYYLPKIEAIAKKYEQDYTACVEASESGRAEAEAATLEQRTDLANRAENSCQLLSQCSVIESAEKVFECFVEGGSENARTMYGINADASEHLADLQEEFRLINNREYKCTNETKRIYEKDSVKAYEDLNNCILGISDVPAETTDSPVVTVTPAETESTAESSQSTESTVDPEDIMPEEDLSPLRKKIRDRLHKHKY